MKGKGNVNPDMFVMEQEGFPNCCGITVICGMPEGGEGAVREGYQEMDWDYTLQREVVGPNTIEVDPKAQFTADLKTQLGTLPRQGHVKMVALSQTQPFAINMMRELGWQEIGTFKNSNSGNMVYVFAIGFQRPKKVAPAKTASRKKVKREL